DVGFGKTEIAMRAAFKAAMSGKQVAVLVPTTVLCQQHAMSFASRMAGFPVIVESISRFKSKKEQTQIINRVAEGKVDILIGTHRLVSKDVKFRELGLLVIDEEQKFGVETKDALKKLRETVDVLTMTATPIPRTLHMSLLGIRDISSLTTPPQHRKAVATSLHKWKDDFIRDHIRFELQREGQVFFVHNRVLDIKDVAARIATLVPEARVGVGHGQMGEHELEDVMLDFVEGKLDVLVSTTIIESGIDVQTANTMFINHAQNHGLANLHQLRGRVGRFRHAAFCYLLIPEQMNMKEVAEKRLKAILEHTKLGSGFFIAMRDLEIRGAGNIIGKEQSGFIASIGYDLYCQMLEHAVRQLQGGQVISEVDTTVDLDITTVLPNAWVKDPENRAEVYRLIARCATPDHIDQVRAELEDRYGPIPKMVEDLFQLAVVRHRLGQLGITSVTVGQMMENRPQHFKFKAVSAPATASRIREVQPAIRSLDETTLVLPMHKGLSHPQDQLRYLWNLLQTMARKGIVKDSRTNADSNESTKAE
ncbi:MAG: DEAD/DEAH box helicase, partial [Planctomycetes bacterium]|nr:DEAD/DEAH box helicase [Planctomycetota bacterium]